MESTQIYLIIALVVVFLFIIYMIILVFADIKVKKIEYKIQDRLRAKSDLIPALYEVSKPYMLRHHDIFKEAINLRKVQFSLNQYNTQLVEYIKNETALNHEIRFIYNICRQNEELFKLKKFVYIRNLMVQKNKEIGILTDEYKNESKKFNSIIKYKNYTILGLLYFKGKKFEINLLENIF